MDTVIKLLVLGLVLPEPPKPGGLYESGRVVANSAYIASQFPYDNSQLAYTGRLGAGLTTQNGYHAAELCALNVLAQIHKYVRFERVVSLNMIEAYILTVDEWDDFSRVLDGASNLFLKALGDIILLCQIRQSPLF